MSIPLPFKPHTPPPPPGCSSPQCFAPLGKHAPPLGLTGPSTWAAHHARFSSALLFAPCTANCPRNQREQNCPARLPRVPLVPLTRCPHLLPTRRLKVTGAAGALGGGHPFGGPITTGLGPLPGGLKRNDPVLVASEAVEERIKRLEGQITNLDQGMAKCLGQVVRLLQGLY